MGTVTIEQYESIDALRAWYDVSDQLYHAEDVGDAIDALAGEFGISPDTAVELYDVAETVDEYTPRNIAEELQDVYDDDASGFVRTAEQKAQYFLDG